MCCYFCCRVPISRSGAVISNDTQSVTDHGHRSLSGATFTRPRRFLFALFIISARREERQRLEQETRYRDMLKRRAIFDQQVGYSSRMRPGVMLRGRRTTALCGYHSTLFMSSATGVAFRKGGVFLLARFFFTSTRMICMLAFPGFS